MTFEQPIPTGAVNSEVSVILQRTQPWVRFFAILGFVSAGLMVAIGLLAGTIGIAAGSVETAMFMVIYPLMGVLYVFPSLYLLRYASGIRQLAQSGQDRTWSRPWRRNARSGSLSAY